MTALSDLIARLEAAKEGSLSLGVAVALASGKWKVALDEMHIIECDGTNCCCGWRNPTLSLDAALTLVEQTGLWRWLIDKRPYAAERGDGYRAHVWCGANPPYEGTESWAPTPALALCIAALKARKAAR